MVSPFAFCPKCGVAGFESGNTKPWHCPSCGFQYFHNMASAVAGLIVCKEYVLMTQRKLDPAKGQLDLPGGFVEYGESLEQAISREVFEELGLQELSWQYFGSYANQYPYAGVLYHTQDAVFIAQVSHCLKVDPMDDVDAAFWVPADTLDLSRVAFSSARQALQQWQQTLN